MVKEYERNSLDIAKYILTALQILGGNANRKEIKEKFVEDKQFNLTYHKVFEPYTGKTYSHFLFDFNFALVALRCCNYIEPYKRNSNIILTSKGKNFNVELYPTEEDKRIQQDYWQKAHNKKNNKQVFIKWCTNQKQIKSQNKLYSQSSAEDFAVMLEKNLCKKIPEIEKEINSSNIFTVIDYNLIDAILDKYSPEIYDIDKLANNADGKNSLILYSEFLKRNNLEESTAQLEIHNKGENMEKIEYPLNKILYGPPGTGKTYHTVIETLKIIGMKEVFYDWYCNNSNANDKDKTFKDYNNAIELINKKFNTNIYNIIDKDEFFKIKSNIVNSDYFQNEFKHAKTSRGTSYYESALNQYEKFLYSIKYDDLKKQFDNLKKDHRIEFITFHQSYSYEDFVEGIKPYISEWENYDKQEISYVGQDGIFKEICKIAERELYQSDNSEVFDFEKVYKMFQEKYEEGSSFANLLDIRYEADNFVYHFGQQPGDRRIELAKIKELFNSNVKYATATEFNRDYKGNTALKGYLFNFYKELIKIRKDMEDENNTKEKLNKNSKKYVLIIDEINRGDVSKIFGELITLIEEDKRIGNKYSTTITLPYSKEQFGVPNNLYIIGTMNTADRSIALLDTALRRRFDFEEMMPRPELLNNKIIAGINLQKLLENINKRILEKYDKDHQIGHSYLMGVETKEQLERAYKNRILPLLNEYFYNDSKTVSEILKCRENEFENCLVVLNKAQRD